jgi:hypothetical protein
MSPTAFHLAILRSAALLVPEAQRTDWLAEWRSELWHVRRDSRRVSATAYCMGAFRDAFWLWRDDPSPDHYALFAESPARCLALLAALGALCFVTALLLPAARHGLIYSPFPGSLVMLAPAGQSGSSISRQRFEALKAHYDGQFTGLAFCAPVWLQVETPDGKRNLYVARTTADLFRMLDIPVARGNSGRLVLTRAAWRRYFSGDPRSAVTAVIADVRWNLPAGVDAWMIEDEPAIAALPASTEGFAVGRLRYTSLRDSQFHLVPIEERSFGFLPSLAIFLTMGMLLAIMTSNLPGGRPQRVGPRSGLFLAAKTLLVLPIVVFGSLDLASLGSSVSPFALHIAFFSGLFAARWILADQRRRCPVCLRLLANPVRMGEPSRILLEWHGTELMCLRGHGMLYVPEWPAIWSSRQRWLALGPSWGGLFP